MKRHHRRGAGFVLDPRKVSTPLDRNQRARILFLAEQLERQTKAPGCKNGVLGYVGLQILRALVLGFVRASDGVCCPSYTILMAKTGLCKQSIANGLARLEACGILRITRRLVREVVDAGGYLVRQCRQGSNLYAFSEPAESVANVSHGGQPPRPFPQRRAPIFKSLWPSLRDRGKSSIGLQIIGGKGGIGGSEMPSFQGRQI